MVLYFMYMYNDITTMRLAIHDKTENASSIVLEIFSKTFKTEQKAIFAVH